MSSAAYNSGMEVGASRTELVVEKKKAQKTRVLHIILAIAIIIIVALVIALAVVASEPRKDCVTSGTSDGTSGTQTGGPGWTAPECAKNPNSPTADLDVAKCVLDSYPLVDGYLFIYVFIYIVS